MPNVYGGFEMFLESTVPAIAAHCEAVYVTCERARYADRCKAWRGVRRLFVPLPANGGWSALHDLLAFLAVFWRVDAVIVLGVSGGIFFPIFRALCWIFRVRLIANVDGLEWRRSKFSRLKRSFLFVSSCMAQLCSDAVVADSEALRPFLVPSAQGKTEVIAYSGDHVLRRDRAKTDREEGPECLSISRVEPENNCHLLLEAFSKAGRGRYVYVGNWSASAYGKELRARFAGTKSISLRDPIFDPEALADLRENCTLYLHGHSVGGTNPSLVEMLFYDCRIIAFDCPFNRATAADAIDYFSNVEQLSTAIENPKESKPRPRQHLRDRYTLQNVSAAYVRLILGRVARGVTG